MNKLKIENKKFGPAGNLKCTNSIQTIYKLSMKAPQLILKIDCNTKTDKICTRRSIHQDDTISPKLFILTEKMS